MDKKSETKTMVLGTVIGALAGAASAYLLINRAEDEEESPRLTAGEGIQVGLGLLGLMRLIAGLGKE
ncbi:MAG: hypothetical protein SVP52_08095 [Chloroflexota bacterium]|nr:hypothetical protein [Chloroflexota bacterium]